MANEEITLFSLGVDLLLPLRSLVSRPGVVDWDDGTVHPRA